MSLFKSGWVGGELGWRVVSGREEALDKRNHNQDRLSRQSFRVLVYPACVDLST
jgi:hypothetical protein